MPVVTVHDLLAAGRLAAEALMVDSCDIHGPATAPVFDENTGLYTSTPGELLYSGMCKRPPPTNRFVQILSAGDHAFEDVRAQLHLPVSAPKIPVGSIATITAAPESPHDVGVRLRVSGPGTGSLTTAQRLKVEEVVG